MKYTYSVRQTQGGAALVVSLIFLLIMTILALSMSQTTTLEERMAGNARNSNAAFQGAEAALAAGQVFLSNNSPVIDPNYLQTTDLTQKDDTWWQNNATEYGVAGTQEMTELASTLADADPRYVIRQRARTTHGTKSLNAPGEVPITYYEVIGRSHGTTPESEVVNSVVIGQP